MSVVFHFGHLKLTLESFCRQCYHGQVIVSTEHVATGFVVNCSGTVGRTSESFADSSCPLAASEACVTLVQNKRM